MNTIEPGRAATVVKVSAGAVDPLRLFDALSDHGRAPNASQFAKRSVTRRADDWWVCSWTKTHET